MPTDDITTETLQEYTSDQDEEKEEEESETRERDDTHVLSHALKRPRSQQGEEEEEGEKDNDHAAIVHAGKKRAFAHVEGNFATHVFVGLNLDGRFERQITAALASLRDAIAAGGHDGGGLAVRSMEEGSAAAGALGWHMSLSRTVPTRRTQHKTLVSRLEKQLARLQHRNSLPKSIAFDMRRPSVLVNEDRTRTFIALRVVDAPGGGGGCGRASERLTCHVKAVDTVFTMHGMPSYYENPVHHMSIAWTLGDQEDIIHRMLDKHWSRAIANADTIAYAHVTGLICRIGRMNNDILASRTHRKEPKL